jgi:TPP-dependent pyruvate/acetoin dehydrogenase alpha subunit
VSEIAAATESELDEAVELAEATADPEYADIFAHVYEQRTPRLEEQQRSNGPDRNER